MPASKTILVVDDDDAILESVGELLRDESYQVATARNGVQALDHLRVAPPPDVILLDLMMPEMDGYEFRRRQRRDPALSGIPTIVFTAGDVNSELSEMGADGWLRKPVEVPALLDVLQCCCAAHDGRGAATVACRPPADPGLMRHLVHLYDRDPALIDAAAPFLAEGALKQQALLLVATRAHRAALTRALAAMHVDLEALQAVGQALVLDAEETLQRLMWHGRPAKAQFGAAVEQPLAELLARSAAPGVRAFGEMVDLLWRQGDAAGAISLEDLWNGAQPAAPLSLLCAYQARDQGERDRLRCVQQLHHG